MAADEALRTIALTIVRFSVFASSAVVFGLVPIILFVVRPALFPLAVDRWPDGRRRLSERFEGLTQAALVAAATATVVGIAVQAVLFSSLEGGELDPDALGSLASTTFGRWYLARLPILVALAILVGGNVRKWSLDPKARPLWWASWALLGVSLLATSTFSGHATVARPAAVGLANDLFHLLFASVWFTGIIVLTVALPDAWREKDDVTRLEMLTPSVMRFSFVALVSITFIAITGTINSFLHVGSLADLVTTGYGRALAAKLLLFVGILGLGGLNHMFLRHRLKEDLERCEPSEAQRLFRRSIAAELAVALALMVATGLLTGLARTKDSPPVETPVGPDAAHPAAPGSDTSGQP